MVNTRKKMRRSNQKAIKFLLDESFDMVHLNPHNRWDTITYFKDGTKTSSKDIAGLFDGFALKDGETYYLQISSNRFHSFKPYKKFAEKYKIKIILLNAVDRKGIKIKAIP